MNSELFGLAIQSIRRKKRSSLLLFSVLLLSFAFAIISLSVTSSIRKTNEEYRYDTYGTWYGAISNGRESDAAFLLEQEWLDKLGACVSYGDIQASSSGSTSIGIMDEAFLEIGRIGLQDGRFPENAREIAMEADLLSALGYDYTVGQEITVTVNFPATAYIKSDGADEAKPESVSISVEQTYILSGVIREYADLWVQSKFSFKHQPLNSAMIVPEAANALHRSAQEAAESLRKNMNAALDGRGVVDRIVLDAAVTPQYYFTVLPGMESEAKAQVDAYLDSTRREGDDITGDLQMTVNTYAFSAMEQEEVIENVFAVMILAVTLLSVVCIYAIRIQDEARQLATFRSIGITKRQLCVMLFDETLTLGVPAMLLGAVAGAAGTWALLRLAVYSGSAAIQVAIPPILLTAAAGLWLLGVLAARLGVFLVALRAPLTGRFHVARKKARHYRCLQRVLMTGLSALFCAAVVFTVLESMEPLRSIRYMSSLPDYTVTRKDYDYWPNTVLWGSASNRHASYAEPEDFTVPKDAAAPFSQIPGVSRSWGWGAEYVRLEFDGMEDVPLAIAAKAVIDNLAPSRNSLPYGIGPYAKDALPVYLAVVDEGDWEGVIDFDIDMDAFRAGDAVLMSFRRGTGGKFIVMSSFIVSSRKEYEETGLEVGDTIRLTAGTPKTYGTVETQVGGIISFDTNANTAGLIALSNSYTIICSEAFLGKLLDAIGPGEVWHEFRQGTPYGYEQVSIYADHNAEYLSTDAVLAELCVRGNLQLNADNREQKRTAVQEGLQTLILLMSGGCCVALVLLLILWNTLSMEAERQKRSFGILQALGMSRRQLWRQQLGSTLGRSVLAITLGWLMYGGYCGVYGLREHVRRLREMGVSAGIGRMIYEKLREIILYWGVWQVTLPVTAVCVALVLLVSLIANQRLMRDDLMVKLRDER